MVPAAAYDALVAALDSSGSDLALGVHVDVRGDRRRRVPWAADVLQEARGVVLADRPGLVVDVAATGKLFRLEPVAVRRGEPAVLGTRRRRRWPG